MRERAVFVLFVLSIFPGTSFAQQPSSKDAQTDVQKLGQRLFEQRCPICHTKPTITSKQYSLTLPKDLIEGNENMIREIIKNGFPGKMPGFKYGMEPSEIDAIIEYLKTVPKPPQEGTGNKASLTS
jgi:mono/diheme cytochrome c family protein